MDKITLTIEEAAEIMNVSPDFVENLCTSTDWTEQAYIFPYVECGEGNFIIPVNAFRKWLDSTVGKSIHLSMMKRGN